MASTQKQKPPLHPLRVWKSTNNWCVMFYWDTCSCINCRISFVYNYISRFTLWSAQCTLYLHIKKKNRYEIFPFLWHGASTEIYPLLLLLVCVCVFLFFFFSRWNLSTGCKCMKNQILSKNGCIMERYSWHPFVVSNQINFLITFNIPCVLEWHFHDNICLYFTNKLYFIFVAHVTGGHKN